MGADDGFTEEQKQYLQGFWGGANAARQALGMPPLLAGGAAAPPQAEATAGRPRRGAAGGAEPLPRGRPQAGGRGAGEAGQAALGHVGRARRQRQGRPLPEGDRRLPLQVLRPVLRRTGPGRVHVPAQAAQRHPARRGSWQVSPIWPTATAAATPTSPPAPTCRSARSGRSTPSATSRACSTSASPARAAAPTTSATSPARPRPGSTRRS